MTLAAPVLLAIGCGGTLQLKKSEVEQQSKRALGHVVGHDPDSVVCPNDMEAKVGQTMRCVLTDAGVSYGVTVTITSVDKDNQAKFDVLVDKTPMTN